MLSNVTIRDLFPQTRDDNCNKSRNADDCNQSDNGSNQGVLSPDVELGLSSAGKPTLCFGDSASEGRFSHCDMISIRKSVVAFLVSSHSV